MAYKYLFTTVPMHSQFVQMTPQVEEQLANWHAVHVGLMRSQTLSEFYDWCDQHVMHAWCARGTTFYFQDAQDAAHVALMWC